VKATLANGSFKKVIGGKAEVTAASIRRLKPNTWLDDEIMNAYGGLIQQRAEADDSLPSLHYLNSFFYQKMTTTGYNKMLARWTKKVSLREQWVCWYVQT
jgi:sentrin-specific protease 1